MHRRSLIQSKLLEAKPEFSLASRTNDLLAPRYTGSITTTTTATASYQSLTTRIQTIRQNIATGQYSYTEVQTQVESFSYEVSTTLTAINDCANCFRPESVVNKCPSYFPFLFVLTLMADLGFFLHPVLLEADCSTDLRGVGLTN
jgi:hypothetical protein